MSMNTLQRQLRQLFVLAILCQTYSGMAQTSSTATTLLSRWRSENPLRISGSFSSALQTNAIRGLAARADAFSLRAQANLLIRYMGIKAPLAFAWSDGNATYQLPSYRLLGVSPSYKWISLHLGDRSVPISNYSLSNHNLRGVGVELKPGHWFIGIIGGRIQSFRPEDADAIQSQAATYERYGWGAKGGYDDGKRRLAIHAFKAHDRGQASLDSLSRAALGSPKENMIIGIQWRQALSKHLFIESEAARSLLTRNTETPVIRDRKPSWGLMQWRSSTGVHHAWTTKLAYRPRRGSYQLAYEHIDPGYQSLGALFFNNDLQRASVGAQLPLRDARIQLDMKAGIERNGLRPRSSNQQQRWVSALTVAAQITERTNIHGSWSNFSLTQRYRLTRVPIIEVDTILWLQTNGSILLSLHTLTGKQATNSLTLSLSLQQAQTEENARALAEYDNQFFNGQITYNSVLRNERWQWQSSWIYNYNRNATKAQWMTGPSTTLSMRSQGGSPGVNAGLSWLQQGGSMQHYTHILQSWIEADLSIGGKQRLSMRLSSMQAGRMTDVSVWDWNMAIQYRYAWQ